MAYSRQLIAESKKSRVFVYKLGHDSGTFTPFFGITHSKEYYRAWLTHVFSSEDLSDDAKISWVKVNVVPMLLLVHLLTHSFLPTDFSSLIENNEVSSYLSATVERWRKPNSFITENAFYRFVSYLALVHPMLLEFSDHELRAVGIDNLVEAMSQI